MEIENIIEDILRMVEKSGLYLSGEISREALVEIERELPKDQDIVSFIIDSNGNKVRLAVRAQIKYRMDLDFKKQNERAMKAYQRGNYEEALEINLKTLRNLNKPKAYPYIFGSIGMCYLKLDLKSYAICYLRTATLLSKEKHKNLDYSELIDNLTGNKIVENEDDKIEVDFSLEEFKSDNVGEEEIPYLEDIINQINNGIKLIDACNNLNLSIEEYLKVTLYLTKEYYSLGMFSIGDKLLKTVEKHKDKSKEIKVLESEIRKNRLFYQYRENETNYLKKSIN